MRHHAAMERARQFDIQLTERQQQVWRLVAKGHTNGEIAQRLGITLDGAKWHVGELLTKLGANTREDLVEAWGAQRSLARRAHGFAGSLFGFSWAKAVVLTVVVTAGGAATAAFTGLPFAQTGPAEDGVTLPPELPSRPAGAVLDSKTAYSVAQAAADHLMRTQLEDYRRGRSLSVDDLQLSDARFLLPGATYTTPDNLVIWSPEGSSTGNAWAFSWTGDDLGYVDAPALGGLGDVQVAIVIEDAVAPAVVGSRAQVIVSNGGMWEYGHVERFETTRPSPHSMPEGPVVAVAHLNDEPESAELILYRTAGGGVCTRIVEPSGSALGSCGSLAGATHTKPISVLSHGGSGFTTVGGVRYDIRPSAVVRTDLTVAEVGIIDAAGQEERFTTHEIAAELDLPYRVAFFSSELLKRDFWLAAYDDQGREVYRQGPWGGDADELPPFFEPVD